MNRNFMRQAQEIQARMAKAQKELEETVVEGSAGGGAVVVAMSGKQQVKSVRIKPEAVDPQDLSLLEDLVLAAVRDALEKSQALASQKMSAATGGLLPKIPGLT